MVIHQSRYEGRLNLLLEIREQGPVRREGLWFPAVHNDPCVEAYLAETDPRGHLARSSFCSILC